MTSDQFSMMKAHYPWLLLSVRYEFSLVNLRRGQAIRRDGRARIRVTSSPVSPAAAYRSSATNLIPILRLPTPNALRYPHLISSPTTDTQPQPLRTTYHVRQQPPRKALF